MPPIVVSVAVIKDNQVLLTKRDDFHIWCLPSGGVEFGESVADAALRETLRDQRAPMILAGVQYLLPIYRDVSSYGFVAKDELPGNPDHLSEHELHSRTWPMIKAHVADAQQEAAAKYRKLAGTGKTSDDLRSIVPAAHQGQQRNNGNAV